MRLHTGLYRCPRCGAEYDCLRVRGEDLICTDCGEELKTVGTIQVWVRRYPDSLVIRNRPAFAEAVERQEARKYHFETGRCPYCGEIAVFHDPDRGGEAA